MEIKESSKISSAMPPFNCVCVCVPVNVCLCMLFECMHVSRMGLCVWRGEGAYKGLFTVFSPKPRLLKMMSLKF